jgi:Mg-chelatase subunit ChlI
VAIVALARSFAALSGRSFVTPADVVRAAVPALAHRVAGSTTTVTLGHELASECVARVVPPTI